LAYNAAAVAVSAHIVAVTLPRLASSVPVGWDIRAYQNMPGAPHVIALCPPQESPIAVTAHIWPPYRTRGWYVRVDNRTRRIDYPLYEAGGMRAAAFASPEAALEAAINAVAVDLAEVIRPD
jgi:hypothetical protein